MTNALIESRLTIQAVLRWTGFVCASLSLVALVTHVMGWVPMPFFLDFFAVPASLLLFALAAYGKKVRADLFVNGLIVGSLGGLVGTVVYDGARLLIQQTHLFDYNGFLSILIFGSWITGRSTSSTAAAVAGWTYHYWNGLAFGIMYALMLGRRHWVAGVVYGIVMECCMLGLFPLFLKMNSKLDFMVISMTGHVFYGAALGGVVQRYGKR